MHFYLFWVKDSYCTCAWTDCKLQPDSVTISVICLSLSLSIPSFSITHTHPLSYPPVLHKLQFLFQSQYFPLISSGCLQRERKWSSLLLQPGCYITNTHTLICIFLTHFQTPKHSFSLLFSFRKQPSHSAFICPVPLSRHTASFLLCLSLTSLLRLHLHY